MSTTVIDVDRLSKRYRLGVMGGQSLNQDVNRWWARLRGRPDPYERVGESGFSGTDKIWALRDIGFQVTQGEILGIIGHNGAGKSTLLKILSRITAPTSGVVRIRGHIASLLEVGTGFHPELTGRENIRLNGAILGMPRAHIDKHFDEIVAFAEVEKFLDTPVKRYSSGMYVRLAFAVAAHLDPEILLVDEVLAVGDHEFQKKCLGKIGEISRDGRTVLMVSHNMPSIINLCTRAILLHDGRVEADAAAPEVVQHYLATGRSGGGEAVWPDPAQAPGTEVVRLHAVRILQEGIEGPTESVDIAREVVVELTYWNLRAGAQLYPAIWLRTAMGTDVLSSTNAHSVNLVEDDWYGRPQPEGLFRSWCRIPPNFLNEGRYRITAILGTIPSNTQVLEKDLVWFDVHDTGAMRKEFYGGWLGVVRPRLAWQTQHLTDAPATRGIEEYERGPQPTL